MKFIGKLFAPLQAQRQARLGVDGKDRYVTTVLGLAPGEVEKTSYVYRSAVQQAADTGRLEELREDYRRGRDLQAIVGRPWQYTAGLVVLWTLEGAGSLLILRNLGVPPAHRLLPAAALTLAMVGLTKVTVAATSTPNNSFGPPTDDRDPGSSGDGAPAGIDLDPIRPPSVPTAIQWKRYLLPAVYGCLVVAVAISRVAGSDAEDVSPLVALSEAIIMVAITCGPAFAATWLEGKRAPAIELARRVALIHGRLRAEERRIRSAERFLRRVDRAQVRWTNDNATLRARFSVAHELATAQLRRDETEGDEGGGDDGINPSTGA